MHTYFENVPRTVAKWPYYMYLGVSRNWPSKKAVPESETNSLSSVILRQHFTDPILRQTRHSTNHWDGYYAPCPGIITASRE